MPVWDLATGKERGGLPQSGIEIRSLAFSRDGKTVALAGKLPRASIAQLQGILKLWDVTTGKVRTLPGHSEVIHSVALDFLVTNPE